MVLDITKKRRNLKLRSSVYYYYLLNLSTRPEKNKRTKRNNDTDEMISRCFFLIFNSIQH